MPKKALARTEATAPSQVLLGESEVSLWRPKRRPTYSAAMSPDQTQTKRKSSTAVPFQVFSICGISVSG